MPRNPSKTLLLLLALCGCFDRLSWGGDVDRPNVVLVMTDDQSIGDFGVNGNQVIRTPHIDALARQSVTLSQFYVSPVCSATRAALMTGRYNYRTRVVDTWLGRSMMEPSEITVAEILHKAGYATGIFGKWHLGDCYPMRPNDQGFDEALVIRGGGLAQPADPLSNRGRYTNPVVIHNGSEVQTTGYCTEVFFDAAERFIDQAVSQDKNFFVYLATNAPHGPYHDVPEALRAEYAAQRPRLRQLLPENTATDDQVVDDLSRVAAMITDIDDNVGRLRQFLESRGLADNTLLIFLCDNGPTPRRFAGRLRGMKCEVLDGGIRSPLWVHWPDGIQVLGARDQIAAHIDLAPTIVQACRVEPDPTPAFDGRSLLPLLQDANVQWPDREIVIQAHRGDQPARYHNFMIRNQKWKLIHPSGFQQENFEGPPHLELYDLAADPGEMHDLAALHPQVVKRLSAAYDQWFDDVSSTRPDNYAPPRIHVGDRREPVTVLTRNEWRGANWSNKTIGRWLIHVQQEGDYEATVHFDGPCDEVTIEVGPIRRTLPAYGDRSVTFPRIPLAPGDCAVRAWGDSSGRQGAYQVMLTRVGEVMEHR